MIHIDHIILVFVGITAGAVGAFVGTPADLSLIRMTADGRYGQISITNCFGSLQCNTYEAEIFEYSTNVSKENCFEANVIILVLFQLGYHRHKDETIRAFLML